MNKPILVLAASLVAGVAFAHHSASMFDRAQNVAVVGTVKDFRWTNPHSWLVMTSKDASGKEVESSIEMNGPGYLVRAGWKRESLKPGDAVTAMINPLRDGSPGGNLVKIIFPDGRELSVSPAPPPGAGAPPQAPAGAQPGAQR